MKKVLVTGANGYIGQHIVDKLLKRNYQVIACDVRNTGINEKAIFFRCFYIFRR
uniref:NAD-dependent epimerase/dehydratase family protein n=1 Tax=Clostridium sp. NkU-1 TaxID=1095009 RepID=UPI0032601538